ncbi:MAG: uncharacterized protein KVP18_002250 [Porospora cf. gigantea A]|uniref:uncharacterized protein n=1 Tax=Porospora cf. gigantea A TaxID=2853593 RepID=UPI00355A95D7|nr:MAG: hypothetical protein KVP18_002250 [Porospora cf. gigantea A]
MNFMTLASAIILPVLSLIVAMSLLLGLVFQKAAFRIRAGRPPQLATKRRLAFVGGAWSLIGTCGGVALVVFRGWTLVLPIVIGLLLFAPAFLRLVEPVSLSRAQGIYFLQLAVIVASSQAFNFNFDIEVPYMVRAVALAVIATFWVPAVVCSWLLEPSGEAEAFTMGHSWLSAPQTLPLSRRFSTRRRSELTVFRVRDDPQQRCVPAVLIVGIGFQVGCTLAFLLLTQKAISRPQLAGALVSLTLDGVLAHRTVLYLFSISCVLDLTMVTFACFFSALLVFTAIVHHPTGIIGLVPVVAISLVKCLEQVLGLKKENPNYAEESSTLVNEKLSRDMDIVQCIDTI